MAVNDFIITVNDFTVPAATDPNKCRIFGFLVDVTGQPIRNSQIHIQNKFIPQVVVDPGADKLAIGSTVIQKTNDDGFVEFDLFRKAKVDILIPSQSPNPFKDGEDDPLFHVEVPDAASLPLQALIHPIPDTLEFLGTSPLVLAVDAEAVEKVKFTLTNLLEGEDLTNILLVSSDTTLVTVAKNGVDVDGDQTLKFIRLAAGTVSITAILNPDPVLPVHLPAKIIKLIVNTVEDPSGFQIT